MLNLQAVFQRKADEFPTWDCVIEKIVELPAAEYSRFKTRPLRDAGFVAENIDLMYRDPNGVFHCLLVLGKNCSDGVLIESEGYPYARYTSFVPGAREFVTARLDQLAGQIIKDCLQNTADGTWTIRFDEIQARYHVPVSPHNGIGSRLLDSLKARPEFAEIKPWEDGFEMAFNPDCRPASSQPSKNCVTLEREQELLARLLEYIGEYFFGRQLYDILHHTLGMSLDDMEALGFSLEEYDALHTEAGTKRKDNEQGPEPLDMKL